MAETGAASTSSGSVATQSVPPTSNADIDTQVDAASSEPRNPAEEDPEIEFEQGLKLKRSEARDRLKRQKEIERASHERFRQSAEQRKQLDAREHRIRQALENADWDALMRERGQDPAKWSEERLTRELQRQQMTPEQIENEKLRQQLQQMKSAQQQEQEQAKQQRTQALQEQYLKHYDQLIAQALTGFGKLPKTPTAVNRVADVLTDYLDENGNFMIDPKVAAEIAYENSATDARQMCEEIALSKDPRAGEMLAEFLGPKVVAAIQKHVIAKSQAGPQQPQRPKIVSTSQPKPKIPPTFEEVRKNLGLRS